MELMKFILFSSLEYFSSFVFILIQFRFSLKENFSKILLISLLISFVSYSFIQADLRGISSIAQTVIFFIYIYLIMKVSVVNSIIMVLTGYIVLGLVQTCIVAVMSHMGIIDGELVIGEGITYVVQVITSSAMLLFSAITAYFKGGFSFVESKGRFTKTNVKGKNLWFLGALVFIFVVTNVSIMLLLNSKNPPYLAVASILLIILLVFFYMTLRKDEVND